MTNILPEDILRHDMFKAQELYWYDRERSYQSWVMKLLKKYEESLPEGSLSTVQKNNYAVLLFENGQKKQARSQISSAWKDLTKTSHEVKLIRRIGQNYSRFFQVDFESRRELESLDISESPVRDYPGAFIGGTGNSGTTLLQHVLDDHPEINSFGETYFFGYPLFTYFCKEFHRLDIERKVSVLNELKTYLLTGYYKNPPSEEENLQWGLDQFFSKKEIREAFFYLDDSIECEDRGEVLVCVRRFLNHLFSRMTERKGARCWIEKTPKNLLDLPLINEIFENVRFVQIFRDPRDVFCSRVRKLVKPPFLADENSFHQIDLNWAYWLFPGYSRLGSTSLENYVVFPYEEFVRDPKPFLRQITDVLGVPFSSAMLETEFRTSSIGRYREEMAPPGVREMEKRFGEIIEIMGYEVEEENPEPVEEVATDYLDGENTVDSFLGGLLDTVIRSSRGDTGKKEPVSDKDKVQQYLQHMVEDKEAFNEQQVNRAKKIQNRYIGPE